MQYYSARNNKKIIALKTTESFGAKNYIKLFPLLRFNEKIGAKTTESYGAKNYTNSFRCYNLTKKFGAKLILSFSYIFIQFFR